MTDSTPTTQEMVEYRELLQDLQEVKQGNASATHEELAERAQNLGIPEVSIPLAGGKVDLAFERMKSQYNEASRERQNT